MAKAARRVKEEARKASHLWFEAYAGSESDIVAGAAGLDLELSTERGKGDNSVRELLAEDKRIANRQQRRLRGSSSAATTATIALRRSRKAVTSTGILYGGVERRARRRKLAEREASSRGTGSELALQGSPTPLGESAVEAAIDLGAEAKDMSIGRMYEWVSFLLQIVQCGCCCARVTLH